MQIRSAELTDVSTIVEFQLRLAHETENVQLDPETVTAGVSAVLCDPGKGRFWMAQANGEIAGCAMTIPEWSEWRNGTVLWIHSVYVRSEFRRQGVFRAIYAHLQSLVNEADDLMGLRLYVERDNAPARRTYESLGMDGNYYQMYQWMKS